MWYMIIYHTILINDTKTIIIRCFLFTVHMTPRAVCSENDGRRFGVVIPAVSTPNTVTCLRSLGKRGIYTVVASEDESAVAFRSKYCNERVSVPSPEEDLVAYKDALLSLAMRPDISTVVPVREVDIFVLSKHKEQFAEYVATPWPSLEQLEAVHDRMRLVEAGRNAGVPVPETQLFGDVTDWSSEQIIKSRFNILTEEYGTRSSPHEPAKVKTVNHIGSDETPDPNTVRKEMKHEPVVQEFVPVSDEFMVGALYDHGTPLATFQHRQIRGDSYTGGGGVYRESVHIPELEEVARNLLEQLEWHGLACIEYMQHRDTGEFVLTEINPRMWQSLASAVRTGADFPYYYWLQANNRTDEITSGYELGNGSHFLRGELVHLLSLVRDDSPMVEQPHVPGRAVAMIYSCLVEPHFDYLHLDDPFPFIQDLYNVFSENFSG